jgi:hypothetical protein
MTIRVVALITTDGTTVVKSDLPVMTVTGKNVPSGKNGLSVVNDQGHLLAALI